MDYIKKLFKVKNQFDYEGNEKLFVNAMRQNVSFHYEHCDEYKDILDRCNFNPDDIKNIDDIAKIPPIPTLYFKHHYLKSISDGKMVIKATSSGTTSSNTSKVGMDFYSIWRAWAMVKKMFSYRHLWSLRPHRFVIFGYEHKFKNKKAIAQTAWGFTFTAPAKSKDYAIRWINNEYVVDLENIEKKLIKYSKQKAPVRTLGFPAYTYFCLQQMKDKGIVAKLPKGSYLTIGGGWKQFFAQKVSKEDFYKIVDEVLGIKEDHIVEFFGAVEHPILWTDCEKHHFHVPSYARVIIRDVDTLEPLPNGQVGLINLVTPVLRSCPICSIMTDDLGVLHDEACECGNASPYLEILGRVGLEDVKTCAAGAEDLLKGGKK